MTPSNGAPASSKKPMVAQPSKNGAARERPTAQVQRPKCLGRGRGRIIQSQVGGQTGRATTLRTWRPPGAITSWAGLHPAKSRHFIFYVETPATKRRPRRSMRAQTPFFSLLPISSLLGQPFYSPPFEPLWSKPWTATGRPPDNQREPGNSQANKKTRLMMAIADGNIFARSTGGQIDVLQREGANRYARRRPPGVECHVVGGAAPGHDILLMSITQRQCCPRDQ